MIALESPWFWLISLSIFVVGLGIVWLFLSKPATMLYALALSVSFIAVNFNIGFTIYVSRLILLMLVLALLIRTSLGIRGGFQLRIDQKFILLFVGTLIVQTLDVRIATSPIEHTRQMFIYLSMMATFLAVIILGTQPSVIIKAVKYYLTFGIVQGIVGIYQVIGGFLGWPMYQNLMTGWNVGNPRNLEGEFWLSSLMPRAFGFFSDVNHYAGYLVGILLLAVTFYSWNQRKFIPYLVLIVCGIGLTLTLSRSGILTLIFGLMFLTLLFFLFGFRVRCIPRSILIMSIVPAIMVLAASSYEGTGSIGGGFRNRFNFQKIVDMRLEDIIKPGTIQGGSLEVHILTRLLALNAWITHPLLGVGMGVNANPWYSEKYQMNWYGSHSHHLDALGQTGLLGASLEWLFMGLVGSTMWRGLKVSQKGSQERTALVGLLAAYVSILVGNLFYHYYLNGFVWFLMGCGVALSRNLIQDSYGNMSNSERQS
jgi:hypothetical protein